MAQEAIMLGLLILERAIRHRVRKNGITALHARGAVIVNIAQEVVAIVIRKMGSVVSVEAQDTVLDVMGVVAGIYKQVKLMSTYKIRLLTESCIVSFNFV